MSIVRSEEEIEILRINADLVSRTLAEMAKILKPGITTLQLDKVAEEFIRDHGAEPGFLGFNGYPNTLCISINDAVVHGIPSRYAIRESDIISIDCGTKYKGYYGDSAYSFAVKPLSNALKKLLTVTKESLFKGIQQAVDGNRVGDISNAVQHHAESNGFSVVRELVGHAVGTNMHEKPEVPNFGSKGRGTKLREGMVLCIEPMVNLGGRQIYQENDGWTIRTYDRKPSAHFELTVVVRKGKAELLSTFKYIDEIYTLQ
ncbi:MAG: type I methionyl aminopeptidase [Bacteroidales bacterium]|jgi:methionyl aminopeptidase|nr:type I methionyl aminopeptidase [Bacteroidales bacterium]MDY0347254.1 type I methionyl aminopeptidase [Tenuifilaceae bacterium]